MNRIRIIIFFLLLATMTVKAQWNTGSMLRMGQNAIYFDDYVSAIENFNGIIRVKPYLSEPYFFRGLAKQNLDDHEGALSDFTKALELNPNYFHAYLYRGVALSSMQRFEEALEDFNEAISLDPAAAYAYAYRGMTEAAMGRYKEAERDYSKALMLDDQLLAAYLNRAMVREKLEKWEGAMADCNAAIRLNMFSDDAYGLRGYLHYRQKDYHNAIEDFNRALKANPENKRILMSRAMVWYEMKKYPETLADYSKVIGIDSNYIYAYYNRALLRAEVGETNAAISDLDKVVEMNPDNILIFFNRGLLKMEIKDWYGAYDDFTESIRLYPDFVKAYLVRSAVDEELNRMEEAEKDRYAAMRIMDRYKRMKAGDRNALVDTTANFRKLIDINARQDEVRDVINGRVQDKRVIIELQDVFFVQYLSLDSLRSGKVQYYNKHIMAYNQAHNYRPSITVCNKRPVYPEGFVQTNIGELSARISGTEKADDYLLRGGFYLSSGDYPAAIADFSAITAREPDNLLALFNLANARMMMYDYIESVDDKTPRVVGERPNEIRKVDYSLVLEGYRRCLEIDPDFVFARFNIGNVYAKNGEIDKAIEAYTQVIRQDRELAEAYFNRGLLYIYIGQKAQASADLSKAGELGITSAYNIIKRYCREEE
ncbi:MAG: tetratricopeptide repeat protein [Odoribacter sp.]|nr:tetratricopeptide repeat protein [Odoribacter sp.]MDY3032764.1 tetratricopeptide repeat protein [Odoribacter sp.]